MRLSYYEDNRSNLSQPSYSVTAIDQDGNRSVTVSIVPGVYNYGFTGDYVPPALTIPTAQNLYAQVYSSTAAELFWQPYPSDLLVKYEVVRNAEVLDTTDGTSYFDNTLEPGGRYLYELTSVAETGSRSAIIRTELTTPNAPGAPTAPSPDVTHTFSVQHEVYSATAAELFWDYPFGGDIGRRYEIYQNEALVAESDGSSFFTDDLLPGAEYRYQIYYFGFSGELEAISEPVVLSTPAQP